MKLVVVDPRMSPEAAMAHEWIPIRPGGDLAFTLSMLHVMLHEIPLEGLDVRFIKERSNLPYLIGGGQALPHRPRVRQAAHLGPGRRRRPRPSTTRLSRTTRSKATTRSTDAAGTPAFALLKQRMAEYTPEWQEQHTTVPAETIRRVARDFVAAADVHATITLDGFEFPLRPAVIKSERGAYSTTHGASQHFAVKTVAGLVGPLTFPAAFLGSEQGPVLSPGPDGVVSPNRRRRPFRGSGLRRIDLRECYPHRHAGPYLAWRADAEPEKYPVDHTLDMLMVYGSNPIHSNCTPLHAIEAFKKIPFMVEIA